jgi:hypothetical protein
MPHQPEINLKCFPKTEDIEAEVKFFNDTIQRSGWNATPQLTDTQDCPILIKQKVKEKKESP